ncbi:MAG: hypothetical protein K2X94_03640 [Amoebophilaceae bacterium]|nr:hypothetical protein [Amoebophilaceae bacterium]
MNLDKAQLIDKILDLVSTGKSLTDAIEQLDISRTTWYKWLKEDSILANDYARACEERTEVFADKILEITNQPLPKTHKGDIDNAEVNNRKLQVDTIKWLMSKMHPKKYSERIDTNITGSLDIKTTTVEYIHTTK